MADEVFDVTPEWAKRAWVDEAKYKAMYEASIKDPAAFWGEHGKRIDWIKPYSPGAVRDVSYTGNVHIRWYYDGVLNVSANCIDRHLARRGDQTAII
ncbi:MAG TPA: acetyl-coenzyme A synthetase N-terminal domain-containing protein, partial [Reyranella sp.]|nr:acetyl-coenzyme A synthetase N-terminal domain-containing protein [Reyranella sp.]